MRRSLSECGRAGHRGKLRSLGDYLSGAADYVKDGVGAARPGGRDLAQKPGEDTYFCPREPAESGLMGSVKVVAERARKQ